LSFVFLSWDINSRQCSLFIHRTKQIDDLSHSKSCNSIVLLLFFLLLAVVSLLQFFLLIRHAHPMCCIIETFLIFSCSLYVVEMGGVSSKITQATCVCIDELFTDNMILHMYVYVVYHPVCRRLEKRNIYDGGWQLLFLSFQFYSNHLMFWSSSWNEVTIDFLVFFFLTQ
jgi:hypothetical protein